MTTLDQALVLLRSNPAEQKALTGFYDLFLNTTFFVPTMCELLEGTSKDAQEEAEVPLIIENDGDDFLVFFDSKQRLHDWAKQEAPFIELPGHVLVEMSTPELSWALNIGTDYFKPFAPDEITWLKEVVAQCNAAAPSAD